MGPRDFQEDEAGDGLNQSKARNSQHPAFMLGHVFQTRNEDRWQDLQNASDWDLAVRYHDFKKNLQWADAHDPQKIRRLAELRRISAQAILDRAQAVLGSVVHEVEEWIRPMTELPPHRISEEIDLETTLEESFLQVSGMPVSSGIALLPQDIYMSARVPRRQPVILCIDTSLSMTGQKLAVTGVALAVVLIQFPEDPVGVVAFENEARVLKRPEERLGVREGIERFLDVPAQGYTDIEGGLRQAIALLDGIQTQGLRRQPSMVLVSDGKYTAGKDPAYLADRVPHLEVLKMGADRSSWSLCSELAKRGNGSVREVPDLDALPQSMYGVVKDLLRGRALQ